ncbi:deoxycytidylate deaminase [Fagus crenata]
MTTIVVLTTVDMNLEFISFSIRVFFSIKLRTQHFHNADKFEFSQNFNFHPNRQNPQIFKTPKSSKPPNNHIEKHHTIVFLSSSSNSRTRPWIGYNGFPRGCSDDKLPWAKKSKTGDPLETKYPYVCHAEVNAILNTNHASAAGRFRLYVTLFPCNECAKIIIQSGVSEVIYFVEKSLSDSDIAYIASHKLLSMAGVKVRRHQPHMNQVLIKFEEPKVSYSI